MTFHLHTDFPGGNGFIERVDGDDIYLRPELRDGDGAWFYWCIGIRGAGGRNLRVHLTLPNKLTARGPAVSLDRGVTWTWLGAHAVEGDSFAFAVPPDADDVYLSMAMTCTRAHWDAFTARHQHSSHLRLGELTRSRQGKAVPQALVGQLDTDPPFRVLLTARHHCCESMGTYTLEGILSAALADDALGRWYREHVQIMAVPFMDPDGVEAGDQGKNRPPRDHNRDYAGESIHPETAALRNQVPQWMNGRLDVALDLHCPWIHGFRSEEVYLVGSQDPATWRQQCRLGQALQRVHTGPLPYTASDNLPFGQDWNTNTNYHEGMACSRWLSQLPGVSLASSVEIPYAEVKGHEVTQASARALGRDLAHAIASYLSDT